MITMTAQSSQVIATGDRKNVMKVEIKDSDGTWRNLSTLEGYNFILGGNVSNNIDQPIMTADMAFKSHVENFYLSPLVQTSKINKNSAGSFSALIDLNREFKVWAAVISQGSDPQTADWVNVFHGKICRPELSIGRVGEEEIRTFCRDLAGDLQDNFIRETNNYAAQASETTIQDILDDNNTGITLYTPAASSWNLLAYNQQREPVISAINTIALQRGWVIREKWDNGTTAWRLTYYDPDRNSSTVNNTFSKSQYNIIPRMTFDITSIRTIIRVVYRDGTTGAESKVEYPENGTATAGGASTLTDSSKSWTTDFFAGYELWITSGTGVGQHQTISSNTGTQITVDTGWVAGGGVVPDNTSKYAILNTADSAESIIEYGDHLFMEITKDATSQIDTLAEAFTLARAVYNDLSNPSVEMEVEVNLFPWTELGDRYTFEANDQHFDTNQTLAVVGYRHDFPKTGPEKTTLQLRGKPSGAFKAWLARGCRPGIAPTNDFPASPTGLTTSTATYQVEQTTVSSITATWTANTEFNLQYYTLAFKKTSDGEWTTAQIPLSPAPEYKIIGLPGNVEYQIKVKAVDRRGRESEWSGVATRTTAADTVAPDTPTGYVLTTNTAGGLYLDL